MSNVQEVWWRPGGRSPFALDPTKPRLPQMGSMVGQFLIIFGGPAVGLVTIKYYPFLIEDRTLYIGGLASIVHARSWNLARRVKPTIVSPFHSLRLARRKRTSMPCRTLDTCTSFSVKVVSVWNGLKPSNSLNGNALAFNCSNEWAERRRAPPLSSQMSREA